MLLPLSPARQRADGLHDAGITAVISSSTAKPLKIEAEEENSLTSVSD